MYRFMIRALWKVTVTQAILPAYQLTVQNLILCSEVTEGGRNLPILKIGESENPSKSQRVDIRVVTTTEEQIRKLANEHFKNDGSI